MYITFRSFNIQKLDEILNSNCPLLGCYGDKRVRLIILALNLIRVRDVQTEAAEKWSHECF